MPSWLLGQELHSLGDRILESPITPSHRVKTGWLDNEASVLMKIPSPDPGGPRTWQDILLQTSQFLAGASVMVPSF
jgi:hypothetical protein